MVSGGRAEPCHTPRRQNAPTSNPPKPDPERPRSRRPLFKPGVEASEEAVSAVSLLKATTVQLSYSYGYLA